MKLQSKEIKKALKAVFPGLQVPWFRDTQYELPSIQDIREFLKTSDVDEYHFIEEEFDCDDFALQLHAEAKRVHHWAFGEAFANKIKGESYEHNLNVFMADDRKIYLVEPQTDEIWEAQKGKDNILIIGM